MGQALQAGLELFLIPTRLGMMLLGVLAGLVVGILPGMGGIVAVAVLLPFVVKLDAVAALAMVTGALAVVHTSDTITSVLIGAPGSAASVPSVLEGHPLAKQGQAARALAAAYLSSLAGGLIGALGLTLSIPIARPLVLSFGSPELFMLTVLGISFAGSLLGKEPRRGIIAGLLGLLLGTVGPTPAAAQVRFDFGQVYLMDGLDLAIVALGVFGIAEVIALLARGGAIAERVDLGRGWLEGARDVLRHRWLVLRGALIGMWAGVLPAIGATAGTWMAYGHVVAASRDRDRFGRGDIRGIIAPEAANNAVEAGDLVPTLLFSVPGSAPAAMIMGSLLAYGVVPGPRIVTDHLDLIYVIVWTFAAANVIGAALMFLASPALARLTYIPFTRVAPAIILMMALAAYQETQHYGDLLTLLALGVLGYGMKAAGWPRAPLLIGFVLSGPLERYFWLTVNLFPDPRAWLLRPAVVVIGLLVISPFAWSGLRALRERTRRREQAVARWTPGVGTVVSMGLLGVFAYAWTTSRGFLPGAALMPLSVASAGTVLALAQVIQEVRGRSLPAEEEDDVALSGPATSRALIYLGGIAVYTALIWVVGIRLATAGWILLFMRRIGRMAWPLAVLYTAGVLVGLEMLARLLGIRLPAGVLGPFG
ncbi:MAG: tripartite tricarboxylate transporter permease [Armatimonadota bacterium]|nr:tripartite tricarboxylate transporter permease [Armatimonadota bacterium]MDR7427042.1 tripartite tricarboxylate transporter permease [Armatimonadota bacterium]MDR7464509.1 tripartite tricarboxylate transporter permease [Armatimonadota bacterium]MDR7468745.1 tripartite tricarboxylate transporter permease [Armatimonadota bacterium]MDR7474810.1 tripartite tricarboxylate transporter permease [Armatimonadota bacterium]